MPQQVEKTQRDPLPCIAIFPLLVLRLFQLLHQAKRPHSLQVELHRRVLLAPLLHRHHRPVVLRQLRSLKHQHGLLPLLLLLHILPLLRCLPRCHQPLQFPPRAKRLQFCRVVPHQRRPPRH